MPFVERKRLRKSMVYFNKKPAQYLEIDPRVPLILIHAAFCL